MVCAFVLQNFNLKLTKSKLKANESKTMTWYTYGTIKGGELMKDV